jgi:glycosyltransferase involved in cell wall biosynthesis
VDTDRTSPGGGDVGVVVPALDEEEALPGLLADLSALGLLASTVVVDNGSRDATARVAAACGARVVSEPRRGYGAACLRGIEALRREVPGLRVVVFLDADRSDDPSLIPELVRPIREGRADLVLGSRSAGLALPGSLKPHQRLGNAVVCALIGILFGARYTDLGPFRAVSASALDRLDMRDRGFGWTVEMQVKAARRGLRVAEIPVPYRPRVGRSKISGSVIGSARAALKIGWKVAALAISRDRGSSGGRGSRTSGGRTGPGC